MTKNKDDLALLFIETFEFPQAPPITILVGEKGFGKTKLLNTLYKKCKADIPTILVEARKYCSKYCYLATNGDPSPFRKQFRSSKLFLFDNLDLLKGKKKTIEELHHTIDAILAQGGKIVITYGGRELDLSFLGERMASKLRSGLIIYLKKPPNRQEIFLDTNKIESVLDSLLEIVCEELQVERKRVLGPYKSRPVVIARYMLYLLLHEYYGYSYKQIANFFGKSLHGVRENCKKYRQTQGQLFETLCQKMYNREQ
ncbi:MAG: DnaA ATPase domain-containing protein [Desulfitobacteriia bacterium]